jgi:hypothetical protein
MYLVAIASTARYNVLMENQQQSRTCPDRDIVRFLSHDLQTRYSLDVGRVRKGSGEASTRSIARELGVSPPTISDVLYCVGGRKPKFETAWANKFYGGSFDALFRAAADWASAHSDDSLDIAATAIADLQRSKRSHSPYPPTAIAALRSAVEELSREAAKDSVSKPAASPAPPTASARRRVAPR